MASLLTFGRDTFCVDELKPGRYATDVQLVAQRCYHRLITPPGALLGGEEEADFGLDLSAEIGKTEVRQQASVLPVKIRNELLKDPTVNTVRVLGARTEGNGEIAWQFSISVESSAGPFDLIVAASAVTVELLGVT